MESANAPTECIDCQDAKAKAYSKEGQAKNRPIIVDGGCVEQFDVLDHCLKTKKGSICEYLRLLYSLLPNGVVCSE